MIQRVLIAAAIAAAASLGVAGCASDPENRQTAGEYLDDAALTAKVKTAIATDAGARTAAQVNVETYKGTVQLSGFVDNQESAQRAVDAAKKVGGVKSVKNDLRIRSS
ncbi:MAG: BON domain-containing protein [Betaproteobacteria bacterium]